MTPEGESRQHAYYRSPIGTVEITGSDAGISAVRYIDGDPPVASSAIPETLAACVAQLDEYFHGKRTEFSLRLLPDGTDFELRVWKELMKLPFGTTCSYLDIANALGNPRAVRAVGGANGRNDISIIIPCHRVIGSNGALTGYAGEIWRKQWLLHHESVVAGISLF